MRTSSARWLPPGCIKIHFAFIITRREKKHDMMAIAGHTRFTLAYERLIEI
jgi:hypothetical protein